MGFSPLHCEQAASFPHDVQGPAGSRLLPTSPGLWQLDGFVSTCSPRLSFLRYAAESQVSSKLSAWLQPKLRIFCYLIASLRVFCVPLVPSSPHLCPHGEQLGFGGFFSKEIPIFKAFRGKALVANPMDPTCKLLWSLEKGWSKRGCRDQNASGRD